MRVLEAIFGFVLGAAVMFAAAQIVESEKVERQKTRDALYADVWKDCYETDRNFVIQGTRGPENWCIRISKGPMAIIRMCEIKALGDCRDRGQM
jgi:hypothetical protein